MTTNDLVTYERLTPGPVASEPLAGGLLATLGLASGFGAVLASSCCVLPLALGSLGVGAGVFTNLEALAPWRGQLLLVSALTVAGAWGAYVWKRTSACAPNAACARPVRSYLTLGLLLLATKLVAIAGAWGFIEPVLLKLLRGA